MRPSSSRKSVASFLGKLTRASRGPLYLSIAILLAYSLLPAIVADVFDLGPEFHELAWVAAVGAGCIWIGAKVRVASRRVARPIPRIRVNLKTFNTVVWALFITFAVIAWTTANEIPLIAALNGADPSTIAVLREEFLKARVGWEASFVYINALLCGALIPYSLAQMFLQKLPGRWFSFLFFFMYCISFVEKVFFLKAVLPLLYLMTQGRIRFSLRPSRSALLPLRPAVLLYLMAGVLVLNTVVAGSASFTAGLNGNFFSIDYQARGALALLLWRAVAIPVMTAAEAIRVWHQQFDGHLLLGGTSSLISSITGVKHIEFERLVFAAQWGQNVTGTGSANSVFLTEAYVNFGWIGVVMISAVVGAIMRLFAKSRNEAFRSLWMLFAFGVFVSGLIGTLLSNGFILILMLEFFVKFTDERSGVVLGGGGERSTNGARTGAEPGGRAVEFPRASQ
jgi:hypothetical protein